MSGSEQVSRQQHTPFHWAYLGLVVMIVALVGLVIARLRRATPLSLNAQAQAVADVPVAEAPAERTQPINQVWLARGLIAVVIIITLVLMFIFNRHDVLPPLVPTIALLVVGWRLFGVAMRFSPRVNHQDWLTALDGRLFALPLLTGILSLSLVVERNGEIFGVAALAGMSQAVQFFLFGGGMILITIGLSGTWRLWPSRETLRANRRELVIVSLIMLAGLFIRVWELSDALHIFIDEYNFAVTVDSMQHGDSYSLFLPFNEIAAFPALFPYLQRFFVDIFGHDLVGLRLLSAVIGTLTIPAVYLLARELFDRKVAFIAAALLVTYPPHLHFSRLGLNNIADPLPGTLALALLALAWRTNRRLYFVLAGVSLGMTQYFYEMGRLFYPILIVVWVLTIIISQRRRVQWRGLVWTAAAASLVGLPMPVSWLAQDLSLTPRLTDHRVAPLGGYLAQSLSSAEGQLNLIARVKSPLLHYVHTPDSMWWYGADEPLLQWFLVPLALTGMFFILWRWRMQGAMLLLLWIGGAAVGNSLAADPIMTQRFVVVFPALVLTAAVGLRYTMAILWAYREWRFLQHAVVVMMLVTISALQAHYYFNIHLPKYIASIVADNPGGDQFDAMHRASKLPENTAIHFVPETERDNWFYIGIYNYLAENDNPFDFATSGTLTAQDIIGLPEDMNQAFFVEQRDLETRRLLWHIFPTMNPPTFSSYRLPYREQMELYFIPAGTERVIPDDVSMTEHS